MFIVLFLAKWLFFFSFFPHSLLHHLSSLQVWLLSFVSSSVLNTAVLVLFSRTIYHPVSALPSHTTMYLKSAFIFSMVASAIALPTTGMGEKTKRAAILRVQDYSQFQISDGVGGNALAEVQAKFPVSVSLTSPPLTTTTRSI